ncbi:MAG: SusC/RagA family TonB-linked outer membrane protein [Prevotella sp.]|nr:SusC/RagA family TonB-linked outer membrane protein [Prevotella sp.]MCI1281838.1 SusC/RagA family TonB-linked outer membrane protein [Prevotella sp.]
MKTLTHFLFAVICMSLLSVAYEAKAYERPDNGYATTASDVRIVKGRVLDENGQPIIGATIRVQGTSEVAVTDIDGNFSIHASKQSLLVVSYLGYTDKEIAASNDNLLIKMAEETKAIDEVVVTALGIKKEAKSLSYNVQQLNNDAVTTVKDASFVNSLNGKVAGVQINTASSGIGGSTRVVMRGAKSINGNNNVLYVVDGIPMENLQSGQPSGIFDGAAQTGDAISSINPDDIESISVLTGPSAASLYGANAANGVILITTKKGKVGRIDVTYTGSFQFSHPFVLPKFQNEYGPTSANSYFSWGSKLSTPSSYDPADYFETGTNISNGVSISAGSEKNQTYLSLGSTNAGGIIHNNNFDRYNLSIRNTTNLWNDKVTLDLTYMLSTVKEQNMLAQGQYHNPLVPVYLFPAGDDFSALSYFERYDTGRNFATQYWPYDYEMSMENPYWETEREMYVNHKERHQATVALNWKATDWMNIVGRAKYDKSTDKSESKLSASTNTLYASKYGHYGLTNINNRQLFAEMFAQFNKYFDEDRWMVSGVLGTSFDQRDNDINGFSGNLKGTANKFTFANVNTAESSFKPNQSGYTTRLESVYATAQIGYKSRAYVDLTAREDWSSKLEKHYFYWSAGISGIWTDILPAIKSDNVLNYLKTRLSYSEVGNEPSTPFLTRETYAINPSTGLAETATRMLTDLKPERTKSWELGVDFVMFKNKLRVNATLYSSRTFDQFFYPTLPASSGYTQAVVNGGRVDNKGVELSARFNQQLGAVKWETYLTWTLNRNKIKELLKNWKNPIDGNIYNLNTLYMGGASGYQGRLTEGGSMSDIYVSTLKTDEHGAIYVNPENLTVVANPNTSDYYVYAGKATPNYNLSWGNSFTYKGLTLGFLFTYRNGGVVVSETQAILDYYGASKASQDARDNNGVLVNGKPIPAQTYYQIVGSPNGTIDSRYVYSATNLRLQELSFGYDIPVTHVIPWIKGFNVSFVARNLWMLYNKAPYDPEATSNTGTYNQGIDYFMQPSLRTMGFSVKLKF